MKRVILTNEQGKSLGTSEIIDAHTNGGKLHKAFSVALFNSDHSKLLLQQRSPTKMLFPGMWANTCCSHPREELAIEQEAEKRLEEECGFTTGLAVAGSFVYKASDPSGNGTEYEYDTVLTGVIFENTVFHPDAEEVSELRWMKIDELKLDMKEHPEKYAPWLKRVLEITIGTRG